jgi:hypothetical protein
MSLAIGVDIHDGQTAKLDDEILLQALYLLAGPSVRWRP